MTQKIIYDQYGDVTRVLHSNGDDFEDGFTIETIEDLEPLFEQNARLREEQEQERFITGKRETFTLVASVGTTVIEKSMREGWFNDEAYWNKFLNDSDNIKYRVWQGRL